MALRKTSKLASFALVLLLTVLAIAPSSAITNGDLDGDDHPYVVLILMEIDGQPAFRCTGTLIDATHVLTAGHCTNNFPDDLDFSGMRIFTESNVQTGDNLYPFAGNNTVEAVRFESHPNYEFAPFFVNDVGMIQLAAPGFPLSEYGELPELDELDDLRVGRRTTFTSVGYGLQAAQLANPTPQAHTTANKVRMVSNPYLLQSNTPGFTGDFSLLLSNNTRSGGTCFGDSGGPNFLDDSNVIAGVTSFGLNPNCGGTGGVFRVDRANVQDFIAVFIAGDI